MAMGNPIAITPSTQLEILINEFTYIRSQNETILQNQSLFNVQLNTIMKHLGIEIPSDWSLDNSDFNNDNQKVTKKNASIFLETLLLALESKNAS